jgi:hypothetical protein
MNNKNVKYVSFVMLFLFLIAITFNIGVLFVVSYILIIVLFFLKLYDKIKHKGFKKKREMMILLNLLRNHCKGIRIKEKWYKKSKYIDGCIYFTKNECKNKNSSRRIDCIGNFSMILNVFSNFKKFSLTSKEILEVIKKNEAKENC